MKPLKILIVDDHPIFRKGIRQLLEAAYSDVCLDEAENGREALERIQAQVPDLVLLDIEMPELDGPSFLSAVYQELSTLKVLVLSQSVEPSRIKELIRLGVCDQVLKSEPIEEVFRAIEGARKGEPYFSPGVAKHFYSLLREQGFVGQERLSPQGELVQRTLSQRETEVARLVTQGKTNREIAQVLGCSDHTVKSHKSNLMRKIGAKNAFEVSSWISQMEI
jgi:DNA-binding NarL/FixJ family response regulator